MKSLVPQATKPVFNPLPQIATEHKTPILGDFNPIIERVMEGG